MSKTNVSYKVKGLEQKLRKVVNELKKEKFADVIKDTLVDAIRQDSLNLKTGKKFKSLSRSTIQYRKYLAKHNKTHEDYSPNKPNLTITGRLLGSIKARITAKAKGIVYKLNVSGNHKRYKGKEGLIGKEQTNKQIRSHLAKIGRDPLGLTGKSKEKIVRLLTVAITERLK